jgi:hypothetical protein
LFEFIEADGVLVEGLSDIIDVVGAEDIECEGTASCDDAGIFSDTRGIFHERSVADAMVTVFDAPMAADGIMLFLRGADGS